MLRVGHRNVYHLYNKVPDLCVFLSQSTPNYNIFGITESWLQMIDNIHTVKPHADILVLGDFNIDLLKPHSYWDSTITLLGSTQLVKSPTRITQTSATLIDHIYTNNPDVITERKWPSPVQDRLSFQNVSPKPIHIYHFDLSNILTRLTFSMTCTGPRSLKSWIVLIPIMPWRHVTMSISLLSIDMHL